MERRYLAATLALAATFAIFSGEFCTRYLSKAPHSIPELKADIACARSYVAKRILAKLESYTGQRAVEQQPMLAELSAPELPEAPPALAPAAPLGAKCLAKPLLPRAPQPLIQMRVLTSDAVRGLNDLSIVRAELLSERGQELQALANQRTIELNVKHLEQVQRVSVRAMQRAQHQIEKSQLKINITTTPVDAMHFNFVGPTVVVTPEPPTPSVF